MLLHKKLPLACRPAVLVSSPRPDAACAQQQAQQLCVQNAGGLCRVAWSTKRAACEKFTIQRVMSMRAFRTGSSKVPSQAESVVYRLLTNVVSLLQRAPRHRWFYH